MLRNKQQGPRRGSSGTRQVARFLSLGLGGFAILALFGVFAPSGRAECAAALAQVRISPLFGFIPSSLTVKSGTTVTWVNDDELPHTVTSPEGTFASQAIHNDEVFSFRFDAPGTYTYFSGFQPKTAGRIVVR